MLYTVISVPYKIESSDDLMPRADSTSEERMGIVNPSVDAADNASVEDAESRSSYACRCVHANFYPRPNESLCMELIDTLKPRKRCRPSQTPKFT